MVPENVTNHTDSAFHPSWLYQVVTVPHVNRQWFLDQNIQLYSLCKRWLRVLYECLRRICTRRYGLILFSPAKALQAACRKPAGQDTLAVSVGRDVGCHSETSTYENVISYPLVQASSENRLGDYFFGGLADATTRTLIHEAIHYNGVAYSQSLPLSYIEQHPLDDCLEIRQPLLYGGILFNHFGHFVSESICRLYAYPMFRQVDPYVLFYAPWGLPRYLEWRNFANQILSGFGIPIDRLIFIERTAIVREVIIPAQKYGFGFLHRPDQAFIDFVKRFEFEHKVPQGMEQAERIYVSRSDLRRRGAQIGEKVFEEYLAREGYQVFYPQQHTLFEQLALYVQAKRLIFSEGSAILSCILLPDLKAEVAVICRRRDQRREIRVATDCLQGYGKHILWIDAVRGQYQFGLNSWDALADIDWYEVSQLLRKNAFVEMPFVKLTEEDHSVLVRSELRDYLREISGEPRFVDHMMCLKETYPRWTGPSHLLDPRNGLPIWPPTDRQ